jgi:flagellar protein FlbD
MILVTRLNKASQFYVNEDMIEFIEETPDTIVTLNTGKKVTVSETAIEIVEKIREEKIRQIKATQFTS